MEYPWKHTRRFNAYSNYFQKQFGGRLQKVSINAGFTCPNRDGSKGTGGCSFCHNQAFSPHYCTPEKSVRQQIDEGIHFHRNRYKRTSQYMAYFQSYSNTYGTLEELQPIYQQALDHPDITGLVIGTRPDCIDERKLAYFAGIAKDMYVILEYGIESCYDTTLSRINRGHTFEETCKAIQLTRSYGLQCGGHLIFGLPGESRKEMMQEAGILSSLPLTHVKFHQLQLIKGSAMAQDYRNHPDDYDFFSLEEYLHFMVGFIEQLSPDFIIERIAGEAHPDYNITPVQWGIRNEQLIQKFEEKLNAMDTWQGKKYQHHAIY